MEVIRETLWKRCLSTPTKPPAKKSHICLSETAYQHKVTRKKCKKTNKAAIIQWEWQCLMDKPHRRPWPKSKTSDDITPFRSDALVSPPNLYPPNALVWQLQCQEQVIDHIPYYLSGLSRAHFSDNLSRNSCKQAVNKSTHVTVNTSDILYFVVNFFMAKQ